MDAEIQSPPEQSAPQTSESTPDTKLDLTKYRTRELVDNILSVISIPGAIVGLFITTICVVIAVLVAVGLIFYSANVSTMSWIVVCAYALICAVPLGLILGILRIVHGSLGNVEQILGVVLHTADRVAEDADHLRSGNAKMPTGSELVQQVYSEVVSPCIEQGIEGAFWILGKPLKAIYRRTIGTAVTYMLKRTESSKEGEVDDKLAKKLESGIISASDYSESVKSYTSRAESVVGKIGRGIRRYVMTPLFFIYCILLMLAALPLVIYRIWYGQPVLEDAVASQATIVFQYIGM